MKSVKQNPEAGQIRVSKRRAAKSVKQSEVELRRFELLTSCVQSRRSPS